jgi:hypothetical protein
MRMNLARNRNVTDYLKKHPDGIGVREADDLMTHNADPLMYTFKALPAEKQVDFLRRHFADRAARQEFLSKAQAKDHAGGGLE